MNYMAIHLTALLLVVNRNIYPLVSLVLNFAVF